MGKRFYQIFIFGLLAGALTGLAFASAYFGKFALADLWHHHLQAAAFAVIVGIILGALLGFLAYFCLWDKKLLLILPLLGLTAVLATSGLTILGHRLGWNFLGAWGAIVFWVLAILLAKSFAPEDDRLKCRK